mgnify:FL=1|tara:strand:+ start:629 stop:838 length:210 start_codon:yes stop_codon:yes gene_type:complete
MTKFGTLTPNGVVNEMEIDLNKVESDDPIAYSMGFFEGKSGQDISNDEDLAKEYVRGYKDGFKMRRTFI